MSQPSYIYFGLNCFRKAGPTVLQPKANWLLAKSRPEAGPGIFINNRFFSLSEILEIITFAGESFINDFCEL